MGAVRLVGGGSTTTHRQGVDTVIPVDFYVPLSAAAEALIYAS